jgi:hypothetical protein
MRSSVGDKPVTRIGFASSAKEIPHVPTNRSLRHAAGDTARGNHRSRHGGRSPRRRRLLPTGGVGVRHDRAARRGGGAHHADHAGDRDPRHLEPQRGNLAMAAATLHAMSGGLRPRPRRQHAAARGGPARHAGWAAGAADASDGHADPGAARRRTHSAHGDDERAGAEAQRTRSHLRCRSTSPRSAMG